MVFLCFIFGSSKKKIVLENLNLIIVAFITLVINLPFGYWRKIARTKSTGWFLAIHIPVLMVIGMTFLFDIGYAWYTFVAKIAAFVLGQWLGGRYIKIKTKEPKLRN